MKPLLICLGFHIPMLSPLFVALAPGLLALVFSLEWILTEGSNKVEKWGSPWRQATKANCMMFIRWLCSFLGHWVTLAWALHNVVRILGNIDWFSHYVVLTSGVFGENIADVLGKLFCNAQCSYNIVLCLRSWFWYWSWDFLMKLYKIDSCNVAFH